MPTITVKNLPPELHERLKQRAKGNRRSMNSEVIACLEQATSGVGARSVDDILQRARLVRERTARYVTTDAELTREKTEGRP